MLIINNNNNNNNIIIIVAGADVSTPASRFFVFQVYVSGLSWPFIYISNKNNYNRPNNNIRPITTINILIARTDDHTHYITFFIFF